MMAIMRQYRESKEQLEEQKEERTEMDFELTASMMCANYGNLERQAL